MSGRSRRVVQNKSAANVAAALERLNAAKTGTKRVETFQLKEEAAVYDVVDEDTYAQLVTKRRMEHGDFVEDDGGDGGYMDMGEEDEFFKAEDETVPGSKKRKGATDKDASAAKRKAAEEALKASKNKERLQQMFAKAAAHKPAAAPKVDASGADDLLEDILGELDPSAKPSATKPLTNAFARSRVGGPAANSAPAAVKTFSRDSGRGLSAASGAAAASGRAGSGSAGLGSGGSRSGLAAATGASAGARKAAAKPTESFSFAPASPEGDDYEGLADDGVMQQQEQQQDDEHQEFSFAPPGGEVDMADNPFDLPAAATAEHKAAAATPAAASTADTKSAAAATGNITGHKRFADDTPAGPDVQASPATGWMEVYGDEDAADGLVSPSAAAVADEAAAVDGDSSTEGLAADSDGNVPFFFMDAYENSDRPDTLYLFGKVSAKSSSTTPSKSASNTNSNIWQSCCVVVQNLQRSLLFIPAAEVFDDASGEIAALEAVVAAEPERRMELLQLLHSRCTDLKAEIRAVMLKHGVKTMRLVPVKRSYAFEDPSIPAREQWVLKVRYPAGLPTLPLGISGTHFVAVAGAQTSMLESVLIKRGLRGPGWAALKAPVRREGSSMVSWCKVEMELANAKAIKPAEPGSQLAARPAPPLTVASLQLRLHMDPKTRQQEILAASVVHISGVNMDAPTPRKTWGDKAVLRNFSVVRKLDGRPWPTGFEQLVAQENASQRGKVMGGAMLSTAPNERALLGCLLTKLAALDADVLVGHNIGAYELVVLLTRLQTHKVQLWSRLGRLRRSNFPKLTGGGHTFGGGAGPGVMSVLAGRLLCDTYLSARELVREVDYTLKTLSSSLLGESRTEVPAAEVPAGYENSQSLHQMLLLGESDAWLALGLAFQLAVLPLTKQLSVVSGSLWSKTLQGARAQRIEMLLLHEFHARKFILPDKLSQRDKASLAALKEAKGKKGSKKKAGTKGDTAAEDEQYEGPALPEDDLEDEVAQDGEAAAATGSNTAGLSKKAGGKGPQYAGGLVLEPKKGLYDKFVIMLDFNSLYPSIIQEFNICFTTVKRPADGSMPALPSGADGPGGPGGLAPLPTVIQGLVKRRREVKAQMKTCRDPVLLQQLTVRQQALKLTANSMYGCLGFSNSRFFARPLAELITSQGRDILQSTVDLVQDLGVPGLEVIYGDTDSIMIHTNSNDYEAAEQLGARIKGAVNRRYRLLEIELDAVYRSMLLLKKKKYAAVKVDRAPPGSPSPLTEVLEAKGLDMVRRDWCPLSKDTGNYALHQILSGKPKSDVVEAVHERLRQVAEQLAAGQLPLGSFIITKQLTKRPEDYPDARSQPHVQVALRRRAAGKRDGVMAGETVPYIICLRVKPEAQQEQPVQSSPATAGTVGTANKGVQAQEHDQQQQPQQAGVVGDGVKQEGAAQQQQQQQAGGSPAPAAVKGVKSAAGGGSSSGGLAERAYHPDELRSDPSLVIDAEYYLGQQVLPVVVRLCAPIEGTNAAHLAQCLGLDSSRYGGSGSSNHSSLAASLREEAMQVTGSLLDDDSHYNKCDPLLLTSPNSTQWDFKGVRSAIRSGSPGEVLLTPPDAVGDPAAELSAAQLANQAVLAARKAIVRYYDGQLISDDEMAPTSSICRDIVLAAAPTDAPTGTMPLPKAVGAAAAGINAAGAGGGSGVLLCRAYSEDKLYTQLTHIVRLLDAKAALDTMIDKQRKDAARQQLAGSAAGGVSVETALNHAAAAVARLRDSCGYRWINLGQLFGKLGSSAKPSSGTPIAVR